MVERRTNAVLQRSLKAGRTSVVSSRVRLATTLPLENHLGK